MGTREELARLIGLCVQRDVRPLIHETMPPNEARAGFEAMAGGELLGKVVFRI